MSELETPDLGRRVCPGCEPTADPTREILVTAYCAEHAPSLDGALDAFLSPPRYLSGSAEADGQTGRALAALLAERRR